MYERANRLPVAHAPLPPTRGLLAVRSHVGARKLLRTQDSRTEECSFPPVTTATVFRPRAFSPSVVFVWGGQPGDCKALSPTSLRDRLMQLLNSRNRYSRLIFIQGQTNYTCCRKVTEQLYRSILNELGYQYYTTIKLNIFYSFRAFVMISPFWKNCRWRNFDLFKINPYMFRCTIGRVRSQEK